jgi:DNA-binding transcriptional LysR family regulator
MWDWTGLQYLLAVAETGTQSAAARRLNVSQPTVGRRLARLEHDLDTQLFDRTPDGIVLTPAGEQLLEYARRIEQDSLAAHRAISGGDSALAGTVRISATEALGITWLTPALAGLHRRHPGIRIELLIENAAVNLLRREADIAVRLFRPTQGELVGRQLGLHAMGLYAARSYLERAGTPRGVTDLADHDVIGFDESISHFPQARWFERHIPAERVVFRSNSNLVQIAAAKAGLGIGLLSCFIADQAADLVRILPDADTIHHELWLVTHADLRRSARIRTVYDDLAETITKEKAGLAGHGSKRPVYMAAIP